MPKDEFIYLWHHIAFVRNSNAFAIVNSEGLVMERSDREEKIMYDFFNRFFPNPRFRLYWIGDSIISTDLIVAVHKIK